MNSEITNEELNMLAKFLGVGSENTEAKIPDTPHSLNHLLNKATITINGQEISGIKALYCAPAFSGDGKNGYVIYDKYNEETDELIENCIMFFNDIDVD